MLVMDYLALISALFFAVGCTPVLFFFPSCLCCGTPVNCGTGCSSTPTSISVTVTGFANNACANCSTYNGATFVLTKDPIFPSLCRYVFASTLSCGPNQTEVTALLSASAGQTTITVIYTINSGINGSVNFLDTALGSSRQDCANLGTIAVPWSSDGGSLACTHDHSSATVTFA